MAKNIFKDRMKEENFIKSIENNIKILGAKCSVEDYCLIYTAALEDQEDLEGVKKIRKNPQSIPWYKAVEKMQIKRELRSVKK